MIVNRVATAPTAYVMTPGEVTRLAKNGEKDGKVTFWLQLPDYDCEDFREAWERSGRGDGSVADRDVL